MVWPLADMSLLDFVLLQPDHSDWETYLFWGSVLSGAPGLTYGTDATWQMNRRGEPWLTDILRVFSAAEGCWARSGSMCWLSLESHTAPPSSADGRS